MTGWTWAAASQCGTGHADVGDGRQDAFRVVAASSGFLVTITCDGAGSASHGRYGAAIACRILSLRAKSWVTSTGAIPSPSDIAVWIAETRLAIDTAAKNVGCIVGDFATTVVLAISDGISTITAHIGDGAVVVRHAGCTAWQYLSWPESGEYAATTYFLTDARPRLRICVVEGIAIDRLALLTDGLERLALDFSSRTAHARFFEAMFAPLASSATRGRDARISDQLARFLNSDVVNARTDDDKTLILAALQ